MESILAVVQPYRLLETVEVYIEGRTKKLHLNSGEIIFVDSESGACSTFDLPEVEVGIDILAKKTIPLKRISREDFVNLINAICPAS